MTTPVMEALLVLLVFLLAMTRGSDAAWCVCRQDMSDSALQKSLDYACGAGADCGPISQNGACYNPNTVKAHCSYAVNSYYQKKGQAPQACDFAGTASLIQQDPSASICTFPTSQSPAGTNAGNNNGTGTGTGVGTGTGNAAGAGTGTGTGVSQTPTGTNPGAVTPTPNTMTPTSSGTGGGVLGGIGPAGNGFSTDNSNDSFVPMADLGYLLVLILSVFVMLRD